MAGGDDVEPIIIIIIIIQNEHRPSSFVPLARRPRATTTPRGRPILLSRRSWSFFEILVSTLSTQAVFLVRESDVDRFRHEHPDCRGARLLAIGKSRVHSKEAARLAAESGKARVDEAGRAATLKAEVEGAKVEAAEAQEVARVAIEDKAKLEELQLMENTALFFAGDNGPDMFKQQSGGSEGLFTGRAAGYWNTGKGSTTPYN